MKIKRVFPQKQVQFNEIFCRKLQNKFSKIKIVKFRKNKTCFPQKQVQFNEIFCQKLQN